jgi:hypothetical protein
MIFRYKKRAGLTALWLALGLTGAAAETPPLPESQVEAVFNTPAQFDACYRDGAIDVTTVPGQVRLAPTDAWINWMGYHIGRDRFTTQYWGRVQFDVNKPVAGPTEFFIFHEAKPVILNGQPLVFQPVPRAGWSVAVVDGASLRKGKNELLFTAGASLAYDRDVNPPINSQVSRDGGKTWQAAPGEYLVRIRLSRYAPTGTVTSTVVDLANPKNENRIGPLVEVKSVKVETEIDAPAGTGVDLQLRSGSTLHPDEDWSAWLPPKKLKPARFIQWQAVLRSTQPDATPVLKSVRISAALTPKAPRDAQAAQVVEFQKETIIRGSYPFTFQGPSAKLARLRADWRLDEIVAPGKTELEQFILLRNWVRRQWPANEGNCQRPWDALNILAAPAGDHGMCTHYAVVFTQCALALGYNARQLVLANHYVADVWSAEYQKWILMDVEAVDPEATAKWGTALYWDSKANEPMSAIEIHRVACRDHDPGRIIQKLVLQSAQASLETVDRRYDEGKYQTFSRIGALVRNNYLDQTEPWETAHGFDYYHCDEYLWWRNGASPIVREFSRHTDREGDMSWTVNQAALILTATESPDRIAVQVDTVTPNFKDFRYRLNGSDWRSEKGRGTDPHSRQAAFDWPLAEGTNTLEIKTRNLFEREGRASRAVVYRPR